jgi:hypothetical protein
VHNVNAKELYYKNVTKIDQDHDKDSYPKLVLNKLKVMGNFILLIPIRQLTQRKIQKTSNLHVTHVYLRVAHVHPCVNYERSKIQLKMS